MILLDMGLSTILIASIVVFLTIILLLVGVLLVARKKLTPQGDVNITINDDRKVVVPAGSSLLSTLSNEKILLPSACGGGGTCGMCRVRVEEGGGSILPTETGFFTRKQQLDHWRLACQVKVKEDLKIKVPKEIFGIKKWECTVKSNDNVATFIKEFVVSLPEGEKLDFKSGGYIQIDVPAVTVDFSKDIDVQEEYREDWDKFKMWDLKMVNKEPQYRAYSMASYPAENEIIMLNVRIATPPWDREKGGFMDVNPGVCSSYIFSLKKGDKVNISGPYGEFFVKDTKNEKMFIGGGAGMAPMRSHIFHLLKTLKVRDIPISFYYGARNPREMFYQDQFEALAEEFPNFKFTIGYSDKEPEGANWNAPNGFIHQIIYDTYLKNHEEPEEIEYYLCGPPMMIAAVQKMLDDLGVPEENIMFDDFGS